jgi:hypothetical protein
MVIHWFIGRFYEKNYRNRCYSSSINSFSWLVYPKIEPPKPQTHNQNQKNAPHSNPAFSKTQAFSLDLTKQV